MSPHADTNWWDFEIEPAIRSDVDAARIKGEREVNPVQDDRRLLEYHKYLGLDQLLECQTPTSKIPDERAFIITHQLFELVFKLMTFDLAVIAKTFEALLELKDSSKFEQLCLTSDQQYEDFWRPALTASERTKFNSGTILTDFMKYLGKAEDETFSSIEFYYFRDNLIPASGFQTAQFRLIQRALGKNNLLSVRLFPSDTFRKYYARTGNDPARVTDEIILRSGTVVATPPVDSPLARVAELDDLAHQVLARVPLHTLSTSPIEQIDPNAIELACKPLKTLLENNRKKRLSSSETSTSEAEAIARDNQTLETFRLDLTGAVERERVRRDGLQRSRMGAFYLHEEAATSHLARVLDRLRVCDDSLFGHANPKSFLAIHMDVARARINEAKTHALKIGKPEPPSGTGGGGIDYLAYSRRRLIPLFPALVAYRGL
jgi:tryptophan 2,3-dioxygenase